MQFNMRLDAPRNEPYERIERDLDGAVKLVLVQLVKRHVHETCEIALNEQAAADQLAHQAADGAVVAE